MEDYVLYAVLTGVGATAVTDIWASSRTCFSASACTRPDGLQACWTYDTLSVDNSALKGPIERARELRSLA